MADIVKKVNPLVPANERSQIFTQADAVGGDVLMFKDSLGKAATHVTIEAIDELVFRFNVYHNLFPQRNLLEDDFNQFNLGVLNLTSGIRVLDETNALIPLAAGASYQLDNDMPVSDMQLVTVSGIFEVIAI